MKWPENLQSTPSHGASETAINDFTSTLFARLDDSTINRLNTEHRDALGDGDFDPTFDAENWILPATKLPDSYLNFLRSSNGGFFAGHHRDFDPLFPLSDVRDYMLAYSIPQWMPLACPIGMDGGATFYLFDMRHPPIADDYPILMAHSSNLGYEDSLRVADSFLELIGTGLGNA